MRTRVGLLDSLALLSLLAVACSPSSEPPQDSRTEDIEAIRKADLAWSAAQASEGLEGTMSFYVEDAVMLPPNMPMSVGKAAIREASAALGIASPGISVTWQPMRIEVARSGEIGYAIGTFEGNAVDSDGNTVPIKGKYVEIWKKQADGTWKVAADMFSPDSPPAPGS
jgi:ketosteroid isomerase-like protein